MKKVLIIAYYTPPLGMGGVQRVTKLSKYLPYYGWEPIILTVKSITYYAYEETFLKDLEGIPIYRSESLDPARISYLLSKKKTLSVKSSVRPLLHYPFFLDSKSFWIPFAYTLGKKIINRVHPDIIFSTYPPLSPHIIGALLKRKFGIPLILDFRDPLLITPPSPIHRTLQTQAILRMKKLSDGFISLTKKIADSWKIDALILENGFDPEDFEAEPYKKDRRFTIGYMGSLLGSREEGFLALKEALKGVEGVVMKIAGKIDRKLLKDSQDQIEYYGYLSHKEAIRLMKSCDVLWLTVEPEWSSIAITGKFFEYMGMGKPILATVRENSEIARYIKRYRCGITVPPESDAIIEAIRLLKEGKIKINPRGIERFNRRYQAQKLALFFDEILGGG